MHEVIPPPYVERYKKLVMRVNMHEKKKKKISIYILPPSYLWGGGGKLMHPCDSA
jgi:hypothetical protein